MPECGNIPSGSAPERVKIVGYDTNQWLLISTKNLAASGAVEIDGPSLSSGLPLQLQRLHVYALEFSP